MKKQRRTHNYKFTEKKHSIKGMAALGIAVVSIGLWIAMSILSAKARGEGSVYLGSMGVLSMLLAAAAFGLAVASLKEDKRFKLFPVSATVCSAVALAGWIALYVIGFMS